jgi:phosphoglycerate dehydrogenase-like enzyme
MVSNQRENHWVQCFNTSIQGKTLLLIGVGHVGADAARWAKRLGMYVIGIRRTGRPRAAVDEMHRPDAIPELLPRADFVMMCAPDTKHSHQLLGAREINALKPGAGLVNYSRAGLVDYEALRQRLNRGEISAVLDAFDPEPLPSDSPLWSTRNLIITPHCSSDDPASYVPRTLDLVLNNAKRALSGKRLLNIVTPELEY